MSRHARTLQKACKSIRNDPFFEEWHFVIMDRDSPYRGLFQECVLGVVACPGWADRSNERLVLMARHVDADELGQSCRPRKIEYAIKTVVLPPPGSLPIALGGSEDTYPPYTESIRLATAFRERACEWEAELAHRMTAPTLDSSFGMAQQGLSSMYADQMPEDYLSEKSRTGEPLMVQNTLEWPQAASQGIPDSAPLRQQVSDMPEYDSAEMQPIRIDVPEATTITQYETRISEVLKGAQFLGRIEMPEEQLEALLGIIASQLDGVMYPKACARRLAQNYPAAVAYALVQVAAEEYAEGEVWPRIAEHLGGLETAVVNELGISIERCQKRYNLVDCERDSKLRYVTPMLLQGGIPDSCICELIEIVQHNCVRRGIVTHSSVLRWFKDEVRTGHWRERQYQISEPVLDFLEYGGAWAEKWVVATAIFLSSRSGSSEGISDTTPSRLIRALERWGRDQVAAASEIVGREWGRGTYPRRLDDSASGGDLRAPMRARVETRLADNRSEIILSIGKHTIEGDFSRPDWLEAIVRNIGGSEIRKKTLSATRAPGGVSVDAVLMEIPWEDGPLQLDIEYGEDILQSYPVATLDYDEPWMMFSSSGRLVKEDVLDHANLWLVLPREARILPEHIVGMREPFHDGGVYDIAWLDLQECEEYKLRIEYGDINKDYAVQPELKSEEIRLRGGDAVQGAFIKGHPIYMGSLPHLRFLVEGEHGEQAEGFAQLEVAIETLDGQTKLRERLAENLDYLLEDDGWLDLNLLTELLGISAEQDVKVSFIWQDANGMQRSYSVFRICGLIIDFDEKAFVLQKDEIAKAEMILPPGWKFVAGSGVKIAGGFDDVVELYLDMNLYTTTYGWLVRGGLKLPIAIEPPVVAWRFLGNGQTRYRRFGGTTESIWLADIDSGKYEAIDIMTTAPYISSVRLEAGPAHGDYQYFAGDRRVVQLKLGQLAETIRSQSPRANLYAVMNYSDSSETARVHVATVHSEWAPESIEATIAGPENQRKISLNWVGIAPRSRIIAIMRPAWLSGGLRLESTIEPGERECIFEASRLCPGPYCIRFLDEEDLLWGGSDDASPERLIWVSDGDPQIREFEFVREGTMLRCSGSAWPESVCDHLTGAVVWNRRNGGFETIEIEQLENGRFEFSVYDVKKDASIVGVFSIEHQIPYRFAAVGPHDSAMETVTRASAAHWLDLFERTPCGLPMRIKPSGVLPITVPRVPAKRILKGLAANLNEIEFSVDDPNYPGPIKLIVGNSGEEFDFSFQRFLCECTDPNCPHPPRVIFQEEWNQRHYPKCKELKTHYKSIRARILIASDFASPVGRIGRGSKAFEPYLRTVADSCFRPLAGETGKLRNPTELSEVLLQSYASMCRELLAECGMGKEND